MNDVTLHKRARVISRRSAFQGLAGLGLIGTAHAQSNAGVRRNQGNVVFIPGSFVPAISVAEWVDPHAPAGPNHIAANTAGLKKAPAHASHYESKLYNFPCGSLRVSTWKKGEPVHHQITFETEIYILQGSATLAPLRGSRRDPVKVSAGDGLFLPSGVLTNSKTSEDFVILQAVVGTTSKMARKSIVTARQATEMQTAQWQQNGAEFSATKPGEVKKAPADAARWVTKRYEFDGNSFRVATFKRGGKTNSGKNARSDVLIYLAKGRMRRTEGDQVFEMRAGDATREKLGNVGHWEILEDSVFIATDAPVNVAAPVTGWAVALDGDHHGETKGQGMKLYAMTIDRNDRSTVGFVDVAMHASSDSESFSAKQDGIDWRIGYRTSYTHARTSAEFDAPGGEFEMHVGGPPHFVARMSGNTENTMQDGSAFRESAGDFVFVRPGALHNSNQFSNVPGVVFNLLLPGTDEDTGPLILK